MVYQQMSINFAGLFWKFSYILSLHKEKGFRHVSEVFFYILYYYIKHSGFLIRDFSGKHLQIVSGFRFILIPGVLYRAFRR